MRRTRTFRKSAVIILFVLLVVGLVFGSVSPALAWTRVNTIGYGFWPINNTGLWVNDGTVWGSVRNSWAPWQTPYFVGAWASSWPLFANGLSGPWLFATFGPAFPNLGPGALQWFSLYQRTWLVRPVWSQAWFRWSVNGGPVGPWSWLGWRWGSDPALYNPPERPDGTPNTQPMVVTNLQFAVSPTRLAPNEAHLDNPAVLALFAASADPVRPGPIIIQPDSFFDIFLEASITEPEVGGSTVLATGSVEDESGQARPFLVQFIAEPETAISTPASGPITLTVLGMAGVTLLVAFGLKRRALVRA